MAEEIQEAVQIIRVAYDGIDIVMKVGSGGIHAMQQVVEFLKNMLDYEKTVGKTSMRKLLMRGGDLQVFQFQTEDLKKFEKLAHKYGILYATLPDINDKDGRREVLFHSEAVPRVNVLMQKLGVGRIADFDEYLKSGDEDKLGKLMDFFQKQKMGNVPFHTEENTMANIRMDNLIEKVGMYAMGKRSVSVEEVKRDFDLEETQAEKVIKQLTTIGVLDKKNDSDGYRVSMDKEDFVNRLRTYQELQSRIQAVASSKHTNLTDITISKTLIKEENEHAVKTRIPGTWGENARYLWLNKENTMEIHSGKTILTFLDNNKEYKIYDEENRVVEIMKGERLYTSHYSRVDASVRKRFDKTLQTDEIQQEKSMPERKR